MPAAVKLLIVDDHPVVVSGCRSLFASDPSITIDDAVDESPDIGPTLPSDPT